jgi:hypothetical protein
VHGIATSPVVGIAADPLVAARERVDGLFELEQDGGSAGVAVIVLYGVRPPPTVRLVVAPDASVAMPAGQVIGTDRLK